MPPLDTRDRDPYWGRMFKSSAELEAMRDAAVATTRQAYDATTRAIANGLYHLGGARDAPVDKLKAGVDAEMRKTAPAPAPKPAPPPRDPARDLLELIAQAEVEGHPVTYDVTFGFGKYDPSGFDKPVTEMTFDEADRFQSGMRAPNKSTPVGKYQFT